MRFSRQFFHPFRPIRSTAAALTAHLDAATSHADLDSRERAMEGEQRSLWRRAR